MTFDIQYPKDLRPAWVRTAEERLQGELARLRNQVELVGHATAMARDAADRTQTVIDSLGLPQDATGAGLQQQAGELQHEMEGLQQAMEDLQRAARRLQDNAEQLHAGADEAGGVADQPAGAAPPSARTLIVLHGTIGPGRDPQHCRIYFGTNKQRYAEVPRSAVDQDNVFETQRGTGLYYVWLLWDPDEVEYHAGGGAHVPKHKHGKGDTTLPLSDENYYPPEDVIALRGYVGLFDPNGDMFRLYFDINLSHYLEIPLESFRYGFKLAEQKSQLNLCHIWIDRNAPVTEHRTALERSYLAGLLEGVVVQDYLGGAVGAHWQEGRPAQGPPAGAGGPFPYPIWGPPIYGAQPPPEYGLWPSGVPGCPPSSSCSSLAGCGATGPSVKC